MTRLFAFLVVSLVVVSLVSSACAGAPAPTPTPTKAPAAAPTKAGPAEPTKAPAPVATKGSEPAKPAATAAPAAKAEPKPAAKGPLTPVKVGTMPIVSIAGIFIGMERGYFADEGLNVEPTPFDTGGQMIPAIASGQLDAAVGSPSAGLFNAIARDIDIKWVASNGTQAPGFGALGLAIRKDLIDSGQFKDYKDLKGKRVAIPAKGTGSEITLAWALKKANLTMKDVDVVEIALPDMTAALANKNIDAAIQNEPTITASIARGVAVRWKTADEIYPNQQMGVWMYGPQFVRNNLEAGKRFMVALVKGVRDYHEEFIKKKSPEKIISILIKYTTVKDASLYDKMIPGWSDPNGYVLADLVSQDQDWYVENGYVKQKVDLKKVIDNQFVDYAIQRLGRYQ